MAFVLETRRRQFELPAALNEHLLVRVDKDVRHRRVLQIWLQGPQPQNLVEHLLGKLAVFASAEGDPFRIQNCPDHGNQLAAEILSRHPVQDAEIQH